MSIEVKQQKKGVTHLAIQGEMTIYTAREQKDSLLGFLKTSKELQLDLSGVSEIDSAGLQILLFVKRETVNRDIKLSLVQHSQAVVEVLELLNLNKYFGDPIVLSANWKTS
ncbi:STAS domain-containing protein [Methylomonas sp. LL1]|uniref:STAS domain-containing protein n=1 Tax=Methylomonas sp. LL1 TaxID=2785785 RepID=UPI0018C3BCCF|nr:STAS domain-containing protein [Methylomonas sp. LL1]QPK63907.1 STAS domain-containing protein [Methylomonas sp. LL1]